MFPMWVHRRVAYTLGNTAYGKTRFRFVTPSGRFFAFCYATAAMGILAYAGVHLRDVPGRGVESGRPGGSPANCSRSFGVTGVLMVLLLAVAGMGIWGYYEARFANAAFGGIEIGRRRVVSKLRSLAAGLDPDHQPAGHGLSRWVCSTLGPRCERCVITWRTPRSTPPVDSPNSRPRRVKPAKPLGEELGEFFDVDFGI